MSILLRTEADDRSLVSCQAHPADNTRFRWTDGLLAVINAVDVALIQSFKVWPGKNKKDSGNRTLSEQVRWPAVSNTWVDFADVLSERTQRILKLIYFTGNQINNKLNLIIKCPLKCWISGQYVNIYIYIYVLLLLVLFT